MGRGLYGQNEGNEYRPQEQSLTERIADNEIVEGDHVKLLRSAAKARDWTVFQFEIQQLEEQGFTKQRIDSMTVTAMAGLRF